MLVELVEVRTGLLSTHQINEHLHAADFHPSGFERLAGDRADFLTQAFEFTRGRVVAENDFAGLQQALQDVDDCGQAPVDTAGQRLNGNQVVVTVDDQTRETIRLRPNQATHRLARATIHGGRHQLFKQRAVQ